jgi:hypothetical protein
VGSKQIDIILATIDKALEEQPAAPTDRPKLDQFGATGRSRRVDGTLPAADRIRCVDQYQLAS